MTSQLISCISSWKARVTCQRALFFCLANGWTAGPTVRCTGATVSDTEKWGTVGRDYWPLFQSSGGWKDVNSHFCLSMVVKTKINIIHILLMSPIFFCIDTVRCINIINSLVLFSTQKCRSFLRTLTLSHLQGMLLMLNTVRSMHHRPWPSNLAASTVFVMKQDVVWSCRNIWYLAVNVAKQRSTWIN